MPHSSKLIVVLSVQNFTVDECGPVHITMGDGGNIEGLCKCLFPSLICIHACATSTVLDCLFHESQAVGHCYRPLLMTCFCLLLTCQLAHLLAALWPCVMLTCSHACTGGIIPTLSSRACPTLRTSRHGVADVHELTRCSMLCS